MAPASGVSPGQRFPWSYPWQRGPSFRSNRLHHSANSGGFWNALSGRKVFWAAIATLLLQAVLLGVYFYPHTSSSAGKSLKGHVHRRRQELADADEDAKLVSELLQRLDDEQDESRTSLRSGRSDVRTQELKKIRRKMDGGKDRDDDEDGVGEEEGGTDIGENGEKREDRKDMESESVGGKDEREIVESEGDQGNGREGTERKKREGSEISEKEEARASEMDEVEVHMEDAVEGTVGKEDDGGELWEGEEGCGRAQGCVLLSEAVRPYAKGVENSEYRGALWRGGIGNWLSQCDASASMVAVYEPLFAKECPENCRGRGTCNRERGECQCTSGWKGDSCQDEDPIECNLPGNAFSPFGPHVYSICAATCDKHHSYCRCGPGSKYPNRPVVTPCGFPPSETEGYNFTLTDVEALYSEDADRPGWCNADPDAVSAGRQKPRITCFCEYDGHLGEFCEIPSMHFCLSQCSGHGHCNFGFCQCEEGWYGVDCSIPSSRSLIPTSGDLLPPWLTAPTAPSPSEEEQQSPRQKDTTRRRLLAENSQINENDMGPNLVKDRKRPLIYVYDLPVSLTAHWYQGRRSGPQCALRLYGDHNQTEWIHDLYGSENVLYEGFLASEHRTTNPEEADFFLVPPAGVCMVARFDDAPWTHPEGLVTELLYSRQWYMGQFYKKAYEFVKDRYPYWNRTGGRDHIWVFSWDEGACVAPKEIWQSTMLVHWGNTAKHPNSTSNYREDNWDRVPRNFTGGHPCYDPAKDIVIPAWKFLDPFVIRKQLAQRPLAERPRLFYFNGNLGSNFESGRPEAQYSWGIRQKVAKLFASSENKEGKVGERSEEGVVVTNRRTPNYAEDIASSQFCGVLPGDGWSGRLEDSILHGCIPVIIQDGIHLPFENFLDYSSFAVRIPEAEIPNMIRILKRISKAEIEAKLRTVRRIWQRFAWVDPFRLEAERQRRLGFAVEWSRIPEMILGDDALQTIFQMLHYKLHNDKWRKDVRFSPSNLKRKDFGLPSQCTS